MGQWTRYALVCVVSVVASWALAAGEKYLTGGPLAGVPLPLFAGQHGEPPGHPGCIAELQVKGEKDRNVPFTTEDLQPERELYPGAEEHWRGYWFKYCPQRSFFDRQSQVRNFTAPEIPGATAGNVENYASPVYWVPRHSPIRDTGRKRAPVPVVRLKVGAPVLTPDLGTLEIGLYAVRVIAAVSAAELRPFRKPAYLRCRVNDGSAGELTEYKLRIGYCDEFYSVAEFYFHAPAKRAYRAELALDTGSEVDLLVRNVSLDDCLVGAVRQPLKQKGPGMPAAVKPGALPPAERLARDAAIWNYLPPPNHQGSGVPAFGGNYHAVLPPGVEFGVKDKTRQELEAEVGTWAGPGRGSLLNDPTKSQLFLANPKLGLSYTLDDMKAYHPLPDPFPYKDNGTGLFFVDEQDPGRGRMLAEQAMEVDRRVVNYPELIRERTEAWRQTGDADAARDAAVALARYAYVFPTLASATWLCCVARDPGAEGRSLCDRRRETEAMFMGHYANYLQPVAAYDQVFDYLRGNEDLAQSIGRFVPWVKTSQDVIQLLDVYLVQMTAKRILRYHYYTEPMGIAELAAVLGSQQVTAPWWDWLFSGTFIYPLPPAGIQDLMIVGQDRNGAQFIGSTFYAQGEGAQRVAASLERFKQEGVLPAKYDLTDPALYPKPLAHARWQLTLPIGGWDFPRIGDVCGPDKGPGHTIGGIAAAAVNGWRWSGDPAFAWCLRNAGDKDTRNRFSADEWAKIEAAAATVKRAPWLDLKSRQVYNWAGILEAGTAHDDPRRRRAAYLRVGLGTGHAHGDTLDLQYYMLGLPMTIDGGQRPGYSTPPDWSSRVHNLVEINDNGYGVPSWVSVLSDGEGARYLRATAVPSPAVRRYERAIALVDTDTEPPTSYVFDVFRVAGGSRHAYLFHGPVSDEVVSNATVEPVPPPAAGTEPTPDQRYLKPFVDLEPRTGGWAKTTMVNARYAGTAPATLETTWRYARGEGVGTEQQMLSRMPAGKAYDAAAPRQYTRLHLFNTAGARVYRADVLCNQWNYRFTQQMVCQDGGDQDLESVFVALHEPYVGEPYVAARRLLEVAGNERDARRAVAVEVTLKSGRTDVLFADGYPEKTRRFGNAQAAGEFVCYSTDRHGLRLAALTGGTLLQAPGLELRAATREYAGTVTAVDYLKKQLTIDAVWPTVCAGGVFEIGTPERTTSYTLVAAQPAGNATVLTVAEGADYYRSQVVAVDEQTGIVQTAIRHTLGKAAGLDRGFTASNDARTRFWRAEMLDATRFQLKGGPVTAADFGPENALRLWEYGVGDTVRLGTFVHVQRVDPPEAQALAQWTLTANVAVTAKLPGKPVLTITPADLARSNGPARLP